MNPNPKGELVTNTANVAVQDTTNIHGPVKSTFIYFIFIIIIPLIICNSKFTLLSLSCVFESYTTAPRNMC